MAKNEGIAQEAEGPGGIPALEFKETFVDRINPDLTAGVDATSAVPLQSNAGVCANGVALHGAGFKLTPAEADEMRKHGSAVIKPYIGGQDLLRVPREQYVIDFSFLSETDAAAANPTAFNRVAALVKPERDENRREQIRRLWWRFGWERPKLRRALAGLPRYIATTETAKHRVFQFIDGSYLPDHMILVIALDDPFALGVLSSRVHVTWALHTGGTLEDRPRYNKKVCFDPFPFPVVTAEQRTKIGERATQIDEHRKARQAAHPNLSLTHLYNALDAHRRGAPLTAEEERAAETGLVSTLKVLHDELDSLVLAAYGLTATATPDDIVARIVRINRERSQEERAGQVRWLRADLAAQVENDGDEDEAPGEAGQSGDTHSPQPPKSKATKTRIAWPKTLPEQVQAVHTALIDIARPASVDEIAAVLKGARKAAVAEILETLSAFKQAHCTDEGRFVA